MMTWPRWHAWIVATLVSLGAGAMTRGEEPATATPVPAPIPQPVPLDVDAEPAKTRPAGPLIYGQGEGITKESPRIELQFLRKAIGGTTSPYVISEDSIALRCKERTWGWIYQVQGFSKVQFYCGDSDDKMCNALRPGDSYEVLGKGLLPGTTFHVPKPLPAGKVTPVEVVVIDDSIKPVAPKKEPGLRGQLDAKEIGAKGSARDWSVQYRKGNLGADQRFDATGHFVMPDVPLGGELILIHGGVGIVGYSRSVKQADLKLPGDLETHFDPATFSTVTIEFADGVVPRSRIAVELFVAADAQVPVVGEGFVKGSPNKIVLQAAPGTYEARIIVIVTSDDDLLIDSQKTIVIAKELKVEKGATTVTINKLP